MQNLNNFFNPIREGLHLSNTQYATLQVAIEQDFDPGSAAKDISGSEGFSAMSSTVGILTGWMGPVGIVKDNVGATTAFEELFTGAARSITATLQASDVSLTNIAEEAELVHSCFGQNLHVLEDLNINPMGRGLNLNDPFEDGYFVDYTKIPSLDTDLAFPIAKSQDTADWLFKVVLGNLANSTWKRQGAWIPSIPMTAAECEGNEPGNGHFLQRLTNQKSALGFDGWTATLPEFWGEMEDKYGITPWDAIESSVEAYKSRGFGPKPDILLGNILDSRGSSNVEAFASFPGIFSLPICDLGQVFRSRGFTLLEYMEYIDRHDFNYNEDVGTGGNCYYVFAKDERGKWLSENYLFDPKC
ncbi:uncharacterized protein N7496_003254 [Penicillium cataractarum]|uniref:Uncharacterized protein n=1 Tax=Penicillium cataractarum TaxID=2100454 RepID=A0A9W9SLN2_9EURO|nr:uncharacterized protein N7496_003254 [Penicillium cataractarum]KAJ5380826.1 hypothetical protein N7496_003254 [Penicillium cataractarum]